MNNHNFNYRAVLLLTVFSLLLPASVVVAASEDTKPAKAKILFDEATMQSGYTVQLDDINLGIPPNVYSDAALVTVRELNNYPDLPEYLEAVSPAVVYNVAVPVQQYHANPIWLSYNYELDPQYRRSAYYYEPAIEEWVALPTWLDSVNDQVRSAWHFPYSRIIIADDTRYGIGPIQQDTFTHFGGINAAAAIAIDDATGEVLYEHNADDRRSIASLTKLMTAYVLLGEDVELDRLVTYSSSYDQEGARLRMNNGEQLSMEDLFYAMTVGSANNAAYALVGEAGYNVPDFVTLMNAAAVELGLSQTTFADPSGLNPNNVSTARDYAKFMRAIMRSPDMLKYTAASGYSFTTRNTGEVHSFANTNKLMSTSDLYITGSKTGYLDESLYCLALKAKDGNSEVITVVLGSPTVWTRFSESERLMNWAFANYQWQ